MFHVSDVFICSDGKDPCIHSHKQKRDMHVKWVVVVFQKKEGRDREQHSTYMLYSALN